jgi:hypothetical protein
MVNLQITMKIKADDRAAASKVYFDWREPFLKQEPGAMYKHLLVRDEDIQVLPISTYGTMFCYRYGKDDALMTQGICLSTILSILTIPVIVRLIS